MRFPFTYTDIKYALKLFGFSIGSFILFMMLLLSFSNIIGRYIGHAIYAVISISTPLVIFFLYRMSIGRTGVAEISNGILHFDLDSRREEIEIENIKSYKIEYNQGIVFRIKTRDGKKLKIVANRNSCDPSSFEAFVNYFKTFIADYNTQNPRAIPRDKSAFEKKGMFYFLLLVTLLFLGGIPYILYVGGKPGGIIYVGFTVIIVGWADYIYTQRKFKKIRR